MRGSPWRSRLWALVALGAVVAANVAVLVSYRVLYEDRLEALQAEERAARAQRDEAREALARARATAERLEGLQRGLEEFYGTTLGTRSERLAPLLEEIYGMTRKLGLRPARISYDEAEIPGADQILMRFDVDGTYADVKKLLHEFETTPRFLVVENVGVTLDPLQPDLLSVQLSVAHYFRTAGTRIPRRLGGPSATPPGARGRAARPR